MSAQSHDEHGGNFVEIAVHTTAGIYPSADYVEYPSHQPVRHALQTAEKKLKITDSSNWVALIGEKEINPDASYADQGLTGQLDIDWGPREGGGGCMS